MPESNTELLCPTCHTTISVAPGWRLAQCPRCGEVVTRMSVDSSYD